MPWIITNTNNKFFIRSDRRGCATPVADRRKAKVFAERFNAEEFLRSLPKTTKNLGYYIASTEQMEPKPIMPDGIAPVMQTPIVQKPGLTEAEYYPPGPPPP